MLLAEADICAAAAAAAAAAATTKTLVSSASAQSALTKKKCANARLCQWVRVLGFSSGSGFRVSGAEEASPFLITTTRST